MRSGPTPLRSPSDHEPAAAALAARDAEIAALIAERGLLEAALHDRERRIEALTTENAAQAEDLRARFEEVARLTALLEERRQVVDTENAAGLQAEVATLRRYVRQLEQRHVEFLQSETWRIMEPARALMRLVRGTKPPPRFEPRFVAAAAGSPAGREPLPRHGLSNFRLHARIRAYVSRVRSDLRGRVRARRPRSLAREFDDKLWGGFSARARADLKALAAAPETKPAEAAQAAWSLARWHGTWSEHAAAEAQLAALAAADPRAADELPALLLDADCRLRRGDREGARARLAAGLVRHPGLPDLWLATANTHAALPDETGGEDGPAAAETERLGWINRAFTAAGLAPLAPRDLARPLALDNLCAPGAAAGSVKGPTVSVLVPAHNAAATLPYVLDGLRAQTWAALEILVIDDASTDETAAVAEAAAARDPRIRLFRQPANHGGYAARNAGLREAKGEFVTVHDADDWSHPQKIERQVRALIANPARPACITDWARADDRLMFRGTVRPSSKLVILNHSSLMVRRAVLEALGGWDPVRIAADVEFTWRLEARFGKNAVLEVDRGTPLAFARHDGGSLTRSSRTHLVTKYHGVRREYREAAEHWLRTAGPDELRIDTAPDAPRKFPAPPFIGPEPAAERRLDVLFVMDFAMTGGGAFHSTLNYIEAALRMGLSVGVFHWRRYDLNVMAPLNPAVRDLAQAGRIAIVTPGERLEARLAVVGYPAMAKVMIDLPPEVRPERVLVVVNQMAERLFSGGDPQYDPREVAANLRAIFGRDATWIPISGLVRRLMEADPRYPAPHPEPWTPLLDTAAWCARPLVWRGRERARPVVGRHGRDHYTKWPTDPAALRAAYCAGRPCDVAILGGADRARRVLGRLPANWTVHEFNALSAQDFLAGLDVFVHYPHEDYIEEFGRVVLEAMAAGVPVILPPVFRETFGEAALYAEPAEVWDRVSALWSDEAAWLARARAGRDFVLAGSNLARLEARLAPFVAEAAPEAASEAIPEAAPVAVPQAAPEAAPAPARSSPAPVPAAAVHPTRPCAPPASASGSVPADFPLDYRAEAHSDHVVFRAVSPGGAEAEVGRLYVDLADNRGRHVLAKAGATQPKVTALWRRMVRGFAPDVVLDIGANYGEIGLSALYPAGTRVFLFEPNPHLHPFLERSIASRPDRDRFRLVPAAVGAAEGAVAINYDRKWSGTSAIGRRPSDRAYKGEGDLVVETRETPLVSIDGFLRAEGIAPERLLFKIDVEGYEMEVFRGFLDTLEGCAFMGLFEWSSAKALKRDAAARVATQMAARGALYRSETLERTDLFGFAATAGKGLKELIYTNRSIDFL